MAFALKSRYVVSLFIHMNVCVCVHSGGSSDLIGGFADFSSPAASASLPTSTGNVVPACLNPTTYFKKLNVKLDHIEQVGQFLFTFKIKVTTLT